MDRVLNPRLGKVAARICTEFHEMPGMRLTEAQVRRAWHLSQWESAQALDYLCESCRLSRDPSGCYRVAAEPPGFTR
jgi:hypothetical protein